MPPKYLDDPARIELLRSTIRQKAALRLFYEDIYARYRLDQRARASALPPRAVRLGDHRLEVRDYRRPVRRQRRTRLDRLSKGPRPLRAAFSAAPHRRLHAAHAPAVLALGRPKTLALLPGPASRAWQAVDRALVGIAPQLGSFVDIELVKD